MTKLYKIITKAYEEDPKLRAKACCGNKIHTETNLSASVIGRGVC
jgi:hypothetical protein